MKKPNYPSPSMLQDSEFFSTLARIGLPLIIQQLVAASFYFMDVFMVGQLGDTSIAALGLAHQLHFLLNLVVYGIGSGSAVLSAQYWGNKDPQGVRKVLGLCLILAVSSGIIFSLIAILLPKQILSFYTNDTTVINLGSEYLHIMGLSYLGIALIAGYSSILKSTEKTKLPMIASALGLALNASLNYALIFGNWGFPVLGLQGAAIAAVCSKFFEFAILVSLVYATRAPAAARINELFGFNREFFKRYLKITLPVVFGDLGWALGITTYNMAYARIGTEAIASINIIGTIEELAFVFFMAISVAGATMVGNRIGAGEEHKAYGYAKRLIILGILGALLVGLVIFINVDRILSLYQINSITSNNTRMILMILSLTFWIKVTNMVIFLTVLRGGGDIQFGFILDVSLIWCVGVPLALVGVFVLHLPVYWVYLLVQAEELGKFFFDIKRFLSKKWINNLVQPQIPVVWPEIINK
jgi:putative MATE family efflux protein